MEVEECSDASKKAYCGVVYLVCRTRVGRYARMLTSKTRMAPLKELSIPRLELIAAFILVKLMVNVEGALALPRSRVASVRNCGWTFRLPCSGL